MRQCLWDRPTHEQNTWGQCRPYMSGLMLAWKILRQGYYWLTMENDCFKHVRKCHLCQIYADKINRSTSPMNNMTSPWPFSMWGIDAIGMIQPKASNGYRFILVAINYFTKWVLHLQTLRRHKLPASSDKTSSVNTPCPNPSYKQRSESQHDMMESLCA